MPNNPLKVVLIGPSGSGKTELAKALASGIDSHHDEPADKQELAIQLWDTIGNPQFDDHKVRYWKDSGVIIFVFDATWLLEDTAETRDKITCLRNQFQTYLDEPDLNASIIVVFNKIDRVSDDEIESLKLQAASLGQKIFNLENIAYLCSAKERQGIEEVGNAIYALTHSKAKALNPKTQYIFNIFKAATRNIKRYVDGKYPHIFDNPNWDWPAQDPYSYALYQRIKELQLKAENLNKKDQIIVAQAAELLTSQLANNNKLTFDDIEKFKTATYSYQSKPGWREVLGAIIGAALGFIVGAVLGAGGGPAVAISAVFAGAKGAVIGASIAATGGAILGGFGSFWHTHKSDPIHQVISQVIKAAEKSVVAEDKVAIHLKPL
jgi:GTPase SAR1 family protein